MTKDSIVPSLSFCQENILTTSVATLVVLSTQDTQLSLLFILLSCQYILAFAKTNFEIEIQPLYF
jgi:hypothetical protein